MKPLITVVIPTYNHAHFIGRALQSVIDQTHTNWEAIVINNHSEDNTDEVVRNFADPRITMLKIHNNGVIAASRNMGVRVAKGEWIAFLDSDDWWYPKKLETVIKYLHDYDIDVAYHDLDIYTLKGNRFWEKARGRKFKQPVFIALMKNGQGPTNSSVVARRKVIDQVGGLSEDKSLIAVEDYDLWLRISRVSDKFCYIPQTLGAYWNGGGNITELSDLQITRVENIFNKYEKYLPHQHKDEINKTFKYTIGRIKQRMGCLEEALGLLNVSAKSKRSSICLKSIVMVMWIHIKKSCHKQAP